MDNLLTVAFEAHNHEKNHHRRYQVTVGRDLLDDWTVSIRYGRTGQDGRELRYTAAEAEEMRAVVRERLHRRLSAPRRIGCPYRLAAFSAAPGFDASAWLPGEVTARFFQTS
jgi:predicted DNA-binding WGR domain protein